MYDVTEIEKRFCRVVDQLSWISWEICYEKNLNRQNEQKNDLAG